MNITIENVKRKIISIHEELNKIAVLEKQFPEGELLCQKNTNRYKWYFKNQDKKTYLFKSNRDLAEKLALKKYYMCRKKELEKELLACRAYLRILGTPGKAEQILLHPEYGRLLRNYFVPMNEELNKWQNEEYDKCQKYEETLLIKGTQGKMLRSKSEAMIDMMLYKHRIPFHYEEKLILNGRVIYPDFVVRHPKTGSYYYWEHFGMMDDEEYCGHACDKIKLYCENGILPSINLITTYETKQHPLSLKTVEQIIQEYFES